jgi:hypothetical protein
MTAAVSMRPAPLCDADPLTPLRLRRAPGAMLMIRIGGGLVGCGLRERIL